MTLTHPPPPSPTKKKKIRERKPSRLEPEVNPDYSMEPVQSFLFEKEVDGQWPFNQRTSN